MTYRKMLPAVALGIVAGVAVFLAILSADSIVIAVVFTIVMVVGAYMSGRAQQYAHNAGQWEERAYVLLSMAEAAQRGMSVEDWLTGYAERNAAEAIKDGLER